MRSLASTTLSVGINECPHIFTIKRSGQITLHEAVDDPDRASVLRVFHQIEDGAFDDDVLEMERLKLCDRDRLDELRMRILFRISCIEPFFVLDEDHRSGAKHLADQVGARVSAVGRDAAESGILMPEAVWGHAEKNHSPTLGQVVGQLCKLR